MKQEALKLADELENKPNAYGDCIQDWLIEASDMIRKLVAELEVTKRKYKDMHNLATQAMSRNHQLEKERQDRY